MKTDMSPETSTWTTKKGLAQMLKGGVIMDVVTPEHAKIAEDAGACAVMALERIPSEIRAHGGVARMSPPELIETIMGSVSIPVMAKARIGHFVEAVRHLRSIVGAIKRLSVLGPDEWMAEAKNLGAPYELVREVAQEGKLPVVLFCAGGVATPADAALVMQLGAEGVFVGSGIFKSDDPVARAKACVEATTYFNDPDVLAKVTRGLGEPMLGLDVRTMPVEQRL